MTNIHDYAYSVAKVRTLETLLLNENEVERMILAKDANEAFKILNEFDYADNKTGVSDVSAFQTVIDEGLMDIRTSLVQATPDRNILNILWFIYDFHNIKTMIKAKLSGKTYSDIDNILSKMGAIQVEALKSFIFDDQHASFGLADKTENYLKQKIKKVQIIFEKEKQNPQIIDLYLDQKLMKITYNIAKDSGSAFLVKFVQKLIDLNNIKLFFRMKAQDKDQELFKTAFLRNGFISFSKFSSAYASRLGDFPETMKTTDYAQIVALGYKHYEEEKTFIFLEKEVENYLTGFIKGAKLIVFGPEPLIAYFLAKRNNALIIRMILVHKLNGIEPEEIKTRLRQLYS